MVGPDASRMSGDAWLNMLDLNDRLIETSVCVWPDFPAAVAQFKADDAAVAAQSLPPNPIAAAGEPAPARAAARA
jgi:hypothetical protein